MVVGVFPVFKLGVLFVKQISKPLAQVLVSQAKNHPVFRTYVIIPPAQFYHWMEVKAKMYVMNLGKPTKVAKLNEQMAIELGANLLGEIFIFSLGGGLLVLEYNRQAAKETKKEEARLAQLQQILDNIESLQKTTEVQNTEIQYLNNTLQEIAKKNKYNLPPRPIIINDNASEKNDKNNSHVNNIETTVGNNKSLVHKALDYYEKDVKKDTPS